MVTFEDTYHSGKDDDGKLAELLTMALPAVYTEAEVGSVTGAIMMYSAIVESLYVADIPIPKPIQAIGLMPITFLVDIQNMLLKAKERKAQND